MINCDAGQHRIILDAAGIGVHNLSDLTITGTLGQTILTHGAQSIRLLAVDFAAFDTADIVFLQALPLRMARAGATFAG
jgi:hypothetical protein